MSLEEYQAQLAALGIGRGSLESGFPDAPNPAVGKESIYIAPLNHKKVGAKITTAPVLPDMSHLNPPLHRHGKPTGAIKHRKDIVDTTT